MAVTSMDWKDKWFVEFNPQHESFRVRRADLVFADGRRKMFEGCNDRDLWVSLGLANSIEDAGELVGTLANHLAVSKELENTKRSTAIAPE